jgi:hypothetical protein
LRESKAYRQGTTSAINYVHLLSIPKLTELVEVGWG